MLKRVACGLLAVLAVIALAACATEPIITEDNIVGVWQSAADAMNRYGIYSFNADGTGTYAIVQDGETFDSGSTFTYKVGEDLITLTTDGETTYYEVEFDGVTLTISRQGTVVELKKSK